MNLSIQTHSTYYVPNTAFTPLTDFGNSRQKRNEKKPVMFIQFPRFFIHQHSLKIDSMHCSVGSWADTRKNLLKKNCCVKYDHSIYLSSFLNEGTAIAFINFNLWNNIIFMLEENEKEKANQFALPFNPFGSDKTTTDNERRKNMMQWKSVIITNCFLVYLVLASIFSSWILISGLIPASNSICNTITIGTVINSCSDDLITWHRHFSHPSSMFLTLFFDLVGCRMSDHL